MTVQEGPDGLKEKALLKDWPIEDGIVAGTTTQKGHVENLVAEQGSAVVRVGKKGFQ